MIMKGRAAILLFVAITTTVPEVNDAALASTWDYCNCRFEEWEPWQDCTSTCFGRSLRTRSVWLTQHTGCDEFTDCATNDEGYEYTTCNDICHNGGTNKGTYCNCVDGYYGGCCTEQINCGPADTIVNGEVQTTSTTYRGITTYTCHQGYNMTGGDATRTCQTNFAWSGSTPSCLYAQHCTSAPCQNGAECVDLLGNFNCICETGWSGTHCENDVQPPVVDGCDGNLNVNATDLNIDVTWTAPTFSDPMGSDLTLTHNYPNPAFNFPWGDFTAQYVAIKPSNGLQTECAFDIRVRPTPCKELNTPINGAVVCNGWQTDYGRYCMVTCQEGYTINPALSYDMWYVCGASGAWTSSDPLPDCTNKRTVSLKLDSGDVQVDQELQCPHMEYTHRKLRSTFTSNTESAEVTEGVGEVTEGVGEVTEGMGEVTEDVGEVTDGDVGEVIEGVGEVTEAEGVGEVTEQKVWEKLQKVWEKLQMMVWETLQMMVWEKL